MQNEPVGWTTIEQHKVWKILERQRLTRHRATMMTLHLGEDRRSAARIRKVFSSSALHFKLQAHA